MAAQLDPIREFPCTYAECAKSFDTLRDMKLHKQSEPEHNYCKKCDVDCDGWVDLTQHKVDAMAPFLEGKMKGSDQNPKHIVCEFCGEDFKSFGGRKRHRDQNHQADQSITCPGCQSLFVRAAQMIVHLEENRCDVISAYEFHSNIQQKYVVGQIMKDPEAVASSLQRNKAFAGKVDKPGLVIDDGQLANQDEDGGVTLLDHEHAEQKGGIVPLEAEVDLIDLKSNLLATPLPRRKVETWPRLPDQTTSQLSKSMGQLSITSGGSSVDDPKPSTAQEVSYELGVQSETHYSHDRVNPSASDMTRITHETSSTAADAAVEDQDQNEKIAWSSGRTSKALFPTAELTPATVEVQRMMEEGYRDQSESSNLFHSRFWDSMSKDYDPDRFFDTLIQRYVCPFPGCEDDTFESASEIAAHFVWGHTRTRLHCPACFKQFKKPSSLIAHAESTGNCKIQKSDEFKKMVDEISGGFLRAKTLQQPAIYKPNTDLVKAGKSIEGVMHTRYQGKMPRHA